MQHYTTSEQRNELYKAITKLNADESKFVYTHESVAYSMTPPNIVIHLKNGNEDKFVYATPFWADDNESPEILIFELYDNFGDATEYHQIENIAWQGDPTTDAKLWLNAITPLLEQYATRLK